MACSSCNGGLSQREFNYSVKLFGKVLCRDCQKDYQNLKNKHIERKERASEEAIKLHDILVKNGFNAKLEKWDKHKHIDIAIPDLKINIEVDGLQHGFNKDQALADLKRTYYSFKKGYFTLRIPNELVRNHLFETAKYIIMFLEENQSKLDE